MGKISKYELLIINYKPKPKRGRSNQLPTKRNAPQRLKTVTEAEIPEAHKSE